MHKAVSLFTLAAAIIALAWWWMGAPVAMPPSPLAPGEKLTCVSYAPFRGSQSPLDLSTRIDARQIEEDLLLLSKVSDCVRTYSVDFGLEQVPEIARRHGLKVMLGLWVSNNPDRTKIQIDTGIALAKQYADVVRAVVVGNEALLRGEILPASLAGLIQRVRAQVPMPVTYADVWEFWLKNRELAAAVDFVTIHILPYWEDDPIPASEGAAHIDSIRQRVAAEFPGQEVFIGEVGWPSAGRMREGALPSPANQALVIHQLMERSKREGFRFNLIEAFDQPWKRRLEGTVGGYWGLFSDPPRQQNFLWGQAVSNHPFWLWQALGGVAYAACVFGLAIRAGRGGGGERPPAVWLSIWLIAASGGFLIAWTAEKMLLESLGTLGWLRSLALLAVAAATPLVAVEAILRGLALPRFAGIIGPAAGRVHDPLVRGLGWLSIALVVLALSTALGLSFDPRYLDFPFASLTAATLPLAIVVLRGGLSAGPLMAERIAAGVLVLCALFIVWNETAVNWQAMWTAAAFVLLAVTLARVRVAPG